MNKFIIAAIVLSMSTVVYAQIPAQQPDPAFMQRAIVSLQAQRNKTLDDAAVSEARAAGLEADLVKERAHSKEFEDKLNPPKPDGPKK